MSHTCNNSQIDFQQNQGNSPELVNSELHCQKKRLFPEKYSRRALYEWPTKPVTNQMTQHDAKILAVASE